MRAAFRRMRSKSQDGQPPPLRVSLYEDTIPRVPPTPGLRPLHGTIPDHMRQEAARHQRARSLPPRKETIEATDSTIEAPPVPDSYEPIRKDWALQTPTVERSSRSANGSLAQPQEWPLSSSQSPSHQQYSNQMYGPPSTYNEDIADRNISPPSSMRADSIHSKVSSLGAVYSEDVADRNLARNHSNHSSRRNRRVSWGTDGPLENETGERSRQAHSRASSLSQPQRGTVRQTSPYSSAHIYQPPLPTSGNRKSQDVGRKMSIARKPVNGSVSSSSQRHIPSPAELSRRKSMEKPLPIAPRTQDRSLGAPESPIPTAANERYASSGSQGRAPPTNGFVDSSRAPTAQDFPMPGTSHSGTRDQGTSQQYMSVIEKQMNELGLSTKDTVDTTVHETLAPAVTHEVIKPQTQEIREEVITRDIHNHDVYHRVLPVIDVEVLPPKHYVPTAADGLVEVHPDSLPGRRNHFAVVETVSQDHPRHPLFKQKEPYVESEMTYPTGEGFDRTETVIRHPPTFETGARDTGQTWPLPVDSKAPEAYGIAPAKVPRRNASLNRYSAAPRK